MKKKDNLVEPIIGVIGAGGFVGKTICECMFELGYNILGYDKYKNINTKFGDNDLQKVKKCNIIFISLPTVPKKNGKGMDLTPFNEILTELKGTDSLIILKSTVLPGFTKESSEKYNLKNLIFMPEFLTERTAKVDFMCPDRIVFGTVGRLDIRILLNLFKKINCPKIVTDSTTAELLKFASNNLFATKVAFANEFNEISNLYGVNWNKVKEILYLDNRIGNDHLTFYKDKPGFGGSCLPKDVYQVVYHHKNKMNLKVLESVLKRNRKDRPNKEDWEA